MREVWVVEFKGKDGTWLTSSYSTLSKWTAEQEISFRNDYSIKKDSYRVVRYTPAEKENESE